MPNLVEENAITLVKAYLQKQGYEVQDVSRGKQRDSEHRGYDLVARKVGEVPLKIEVKGCSRPWGIPDQYETEFDASRRLIADFLYVVYFCEEQPQICVIPRDELKPEFVVPKAGYRISSRFKKKSVLERFLRPI
jgi:hypothetical protein